MIVLTSPEQSYPVQQKKQIKVDDIGTFPRHGATPLTATSSALHSPMSRSCARSLNPNTKTEAIRFFVQRFVAETFQKRLFQQAPSDVPTLWDDARASVLSCAVAKRGVSSPTGTQQHLFRHFSCHPLVPNGGSCRGSSRRHFSQTIEEGRTVKRSFLRLPAGACPSICFPRAPPQTQERGEAGGTVFGSQAPASPSVLRPFSSVFRQTCSKAMFQ